MKDLKEAEVLTMSVPEAGRLLGLSRNSAYEAARRHEIPVLRFGRKLRVPRAAFERLLAGESK
jgi:excisionase family DNA binding protein